MRVNSPALSRIGGIVGGAIVEPGDGDLQIPPVLQPLVEIPGPINSFIAPSGTQRDSYAASQTRLVSGVAATTVFSLGVLGKGLWKLAINFQGAFIGTSNLTGSSQLRIVDPDSNLFALLAYPHITGQPSSQFIDQWWAFQRDGFEIQLVQLVTVGGDLLALNASVHASKFV